MFEKNEYVVYGNSGVCTVEEVGALSSGNMKSSRLYYTLKPYYSAGSTIYTPIDNEKVIIRGVITKEEAATLIDGMQEVEHLWVENEKTRERQYKEALRTCDCRELVKIIKTIYARKLSRQEEGKKVTASDAKYFQMAEEQLYGELAIVLNLERQEVKEYISNKVQA